MDIPRASSVCSFVDVNMVKNSRAEKRASVGSSLL